LRTGGTVQSSKLIETGRRLLQADEKKPVRGLVFWFKASKLDTEDVRVYRDESSVSEAFIISFFHYGSLRLVNAACVDRKRIEYVNGNHLGPDRSTMPAPNTRAIMEFFDILPKSIFARAVSINTNQIPRTEIQKLCRNPGRVQIIESVTCHDPKKYVGPTIYDHYEQTLFGFRPERLDDQRGPNGEPAPSDDLEEIYRWRRKEIRANELRSPHNCVLNVAHIRKFDDLNSYSDEDIIKETKILRSYPQGDHKNLILFWFRAQDVLDVNGRIYLDTTAVVADSYLVSLGDKHKLSNVHAVCVPRK